MITPAGHWAQGHPLSAALVAAVACGMLALAGWCTYRLLRAAARPSGSVLVASVGAAVCTAYSADTSWRFAEHRLGMADTTERLFMFGAAELALLACALLARASKRTTATDGRSGSPGVPGVLVWVLTGVQIVPAFAESGPVGGLVRAVVGPVMAGLLWHHAMGLEIRLARPGALSSGLLAQIGRELRERLLSRLGLAQRDRTAEQISRDRAMHKAVRLAALLAHAPRGPLAGRRRRRLAAAVHRAGIASNGEQRHRFLRELGARRGADALPTITAPAPWDEPSAPESAPPTLLGLAGALLRQMHPVDAVHLVRDAHPGATPAEIAAELTRHGVVVSETQVQIACREGASELPSVHPAALKAASAAGQRRSRIDVRVPDTDRDAGPDADASATPDAHPDAPHTEEPDPRLEEARALDQEHRASHNGRPASLRTLQREMRIGQARAQSIRRQLDATSHHGSTR
ncbi:hypothetical protein ACF1DY_01890 [Streptomyces albus]